MGEKVLIFDFDDSLADENTDTYILGVLNQRPLPESVRAKRKGVWTDYMAAIFEYFQSSGVRMDDILRYIRQVLCCNKIL